MSDSLSLRAAGLRTGIRLEVLTISWMVLEGIVAVAAGVAAGSVLLVAFGLDSLIELVSGGTLLWRLRSEAKLRSDEAVEAAEGRAELVVGVLLAVLCVYVATASIVGLVDHSKPRVSIAGMALAGAALLIMPALAWGKRHVAGRIESPALRGDSAQSLTCAYMAGTVLLGLALSSIHGLWWVQDGAALIFLGWLVSETREIWLERLRD